MRLQGSDRSSGQMRLRLKKVLREIFDDPNVIITDTLSSSSYNKWDSLAQARLIVSLEEEFDVQFTTEEVTSLNSVAAIEQALRLRR